MEGYDWTLVPGCLTYTENVCKKRNEEDLRSLVLNDMEEMYRLISLEDELPYFDNYMKDLRHYNANYKRRETQDGDKVEDVPSEKDKRVYVYMGYLIREVIARYKLEHKHKRSTPTDSVAILENFHERIGNLESYLPAPHQRRRLP
jgi:hypothetical protein